ncbi:MJ1477/TM1410 family putative glycoside hydrolase [Deinococcus sp. VB142]|uniref:MJ1477/TM1410 family putative glycoside hydrolase n=1 Tax=Deinococcus sp. VB142 TaxID=3112952 RepID=A0AAU6Q1F0_9DEIO
MKRFLSVSLAAALAACSVAPAEQTTEPAPSTPPPPPTTARPSLSDVQHWAVQLTGYGKTRLSAVTASPFELVVVDPFDDDGQPWTKAEVRAAAQGRWLVAYLSMGAAESYRAYWKAGWRVGSPAWLLREDPDWPGNFDVAYWHPEWQRIALAQLDRVIDQGFDGVYMDLIDAYERHPGRPTARAEMVGWVCKIAAHARAKNPQFVIIPQNAAELIRDPGYAACVDASGNEETFVYATNRPTEAERQRELLADYKLWQQAGKPVFTIEYADQPELMKSAAARARAAGLVPYLAERSLDRLILNQP